MEQHERTAEAYDSALAEFGLTPYRPEMRSRLLTALDQLYCALREVSACITGDNIDPILTTAIARHACLLVTDTRETVGAMFEHYHRTFGPNGIARREAAKLEPPTPYDYERVRALALKQDGPQTPTRTGRSVRRADAYANGSQCRLIGEPDTAAVPEIDRATLHSDERFRAFVNTRLIVCQTSLVGALLAESACGASWDMIEVRDDPETNEPREIFEWWLCESWLLDRLEERGEAVLRIDGGAWWGRCATGQSCALDDVLQDIWIDLQKPYHP